MVMMVVVVMMMPMMMMHRLNLRWARRRHIGSKSANAKRSDHNGNKYR